MKAFKLSFLLVLINTQSILGIYPGSYYGFAISSEEIDNLVEKKETLKDLVRPPTITAADVTVDISNRYATTVYKTSVRNPSNITQEFDFVVITPEEAYITAFSMNVNGKDYPAKVHEKKKADNLYNNEVNSGRSSAKVSASARNSNKFIVNVNIDPNTTTIFSLTHEELLKRINNNYQQKINLKYKQLIDSLKVTVKIHESANLTDVKVLPLSSGTSITTNNSTDLEVSAKIERPNNVTAIVTFNPSIEDQKRYGTLLKAPENEGRLQIAPANEGIDGQFIVTYDVQREENGGEILTEDGYFVHFFAPPNLPAIPKNVIFVFDTSGSMSGRRIEQLKEGMKKCTSNVNKDDVMSFIEFNSDITVHNLDAPSESIKIGPPRGGNYWMRKNNVTAYQETQTDYSKLSFPPAYPSNEDTKKKIFDLIDSLRATQSTNIYESLRAAVHLAGLTEERTKAQNDIHRQTIILFCTDGEATEGLTGTEEIISAVSKLNTKGTPIFTMSFGDSCDKTMLRGLAGKNNGLSRHIYEGADAGLQIGDFYKEISSPLLSNVTFKYSDNVTEHTRIDYPIYYRGSEFVIAGKIADKQLEIMPIVRCGWPIRPFPRPQIKKVKTGNVEKSWAYLTIKQHLDKEENDKALKLALQYSFVTPLTSMVVIKPNATPIAIDPVEATADEGNSNRYGFGGRGGGIMMKKAYGPMPMSMGSSMRSFATNSVSSIAAMPMDLDGSTTNFASMKKTKVMDKGMMISKPAKGGFVYDTESAPVAKKITIMLPQNISTAMPWLSGFINSEGRLNFLNGQYEFSFGNSTVNSIVSSCTTIGSGSGTCKSLEVVDSSVYKNIVDPITFKNFFCPINSQQPTGETIKYIGLCCPLPKPQVV